LRVVPLGYSSGSAQRIFQYLIGQKEEKMFVAPEVQKIVIVSRRYWIEVLILWKFSSYS